MAIRSLKQLNVADKKKSFLSDIEHTLPTVYSAPKQGLNYAVSYDRNFAVGAYVPQSVQYNKVNPYQQRIVQKKQLVVDNVNVVGSSPSCNNLLTKNSCCSSPNWFYSCVATNTKSVCVSNQSNGAYVPLPISQNQAFKTCQYINNSVQLGLKSQFSQRFSNSFK